MLIDGERLKLLLATARSEVLLCAPFIKLQAFNVVLSAVPAGIPVNVITRWRAEEVASGVTDLDVFDAVNARAGTKLGLINELHAKIYMVDGQCLVGSANLTGAALGWSAIPNLELLVEGTASEPNVARLLARLTSAIPASLDMKNRIAEQAAALNVPAILGEAPISVEAIEQAGLAWLPRCAMPDRLFFVYQNPTTPNVIPGTRADALDDLRDLMPPSGLSQTAFVAFVSASLKEFPAFRQFLDRIPARLTDQDARQLVAELRPGLSDGDARKQWQIVRDWISVFFADRFEVAPETFVVRIRS